MPNGPMMPPSMAAGASGAGAVGAEVAGFDDDELGMFMDTETQNDFEFGLIDNSLLLAMALAGATLDPILEKKLGVTMGGTTADGLFTLQQSECLGACADSPVMLVNDLHMCSFMNNEKLDQLIDGLTSAEAQQP
jgi:(2Fe-2S) ferredoxin